MTSGTDEERQRRVFFEIHSGNPREGPGDTASARRAWAALGDLPPRPRVLDVGCGPGGQTQDLARFAGTTVVAVDNHLPFLRSLPRRLDSVPSSSTSSGPGISPVAADMKRLPFRPESFDVVWSEGAIYIAGFDAGLEDWRPLLKSGGAIAVTEISWLRDDPSAELAAFWHEAYPAMRSVPANEAAVRAAGYDLVDCFALPESSWWDSYYTPIEQKLPQFRQRYAHDPVALQVIEAEQQEIDLYRTCSDWYGYVFYIGRRND